jgi:hypothetical protein
VFWFASPDITRFCGANSSKLLNTAVSQLPNPSPAITAPQIYNPYPSAFASTTIKPALGVSYAYCVDLNLLLSRHPRDRSDAGHAAGGRRKFGGVTEWNEDVVIEVLGDRKGDRAGMWGAFTIVGGLATCVGVELIGVWTGWHQIECENISCLDMRCPSPLDYG